MRVAVIGSRTFSDYNLMKEALSEIFITQIVSGGANGADKLAERYAKENDIPTKIYLPDWNKHGISAGFIRNTDIINDAEYVVAFWNGKSKGTLDSINKAKAANKEVIIIKF